MNSGPHMLELLFLGTGASIPSRDKSLPCMAVRCGSDITLFDCGEGTQRQMMISTFSFMKVNQIFITHMHGDHVLGLPGLLQTMGMAGRKELLRVFGPKGIVDGISGMLASCEGAVEYPLEIEEIENGETVIFDNFSVTAYGTEHGIPSMGYILREKDRKGKFNKAKAIELGVEPGPDFTKLQNGETVGSVSPDQVIAVSKPGCSVAYSGDTVPCTSLTESVKGVDVLVHEATFLKKEEQLAKDHFHSTAYDAAVTAKTVGARMLMLIHISNRYDDISVAEDEAKSVFGNSVAVTDMQMFRITAGDIISI